MAAIKWGSGVSGNWSLGTNWSSGTVPSGIDDVTVDAAGSYTINVNGGFNVNSLVFDASGATINIPSGDSLNALHGATITGGTIDGPGHLFTSDVSMITSGTPLTIGGGLTWEALSGSVSLDAAVNVGDAAGATATIENVGGTTFNLISDAAGIGINPSGSGNFSNSGTLAKTGGTGISHIAVSVTSTGTVSVTTGVLEFDGPSNSFSGTISGTGTVAFGAGHSQLAINPTVSNFLVNGGNVSFTPVLNYFGNFTETSGALTLGGNTPTITGSFTLTGGALNFNAGATFTLPATTAFAGGTITGGTVAMNGNTTVTGTTVIQAAVVNNGTIAAGGGLFDLSGAVSGNGQTTIGNSATVEFGQASAATQHVNFANATGTLKIDQPSLFKSQIAGFQMGDTIDFAGLSATAALYLNGNLTLFDGTTPVEQLTASTPYSRSLFRVASDGSGGTDVTVTQTPPPPTAYDFNGDKTSDILWQNTNGQAATWLLNNTAPFNESVVGGNPGPSWQVIGAGDFNGDGDADILWQNTNGQPAVWLMNGTTPFSEVAVGSNPGPSWQVIGAGDFNGDNNADILWQNTNGQAAIWLMNGTTPLSEPLVGNNPGPSWHVVGTGDFNGDGDADILWQNTNGQAAIWLMNGATPFSETVVGNPGPSWHIIGAGDFNGDGDADILWQNTNGQAAIWLMNGATPFNEQLVGTNPGPSWQVLGAGDYNGDGKSDILWQNTNGQASIWLMNGTTPTFEGLVGSNPGPTWHIHAAS